MSFATDIITVVHKDGTIKGTPFCVRFKTQKLKRVVTVFVNGKQIIANECGWGLIVEAGGCFAKFAKIDPLTHEPEKKKKGPLLKRILHKHASTSCLSITANSPEFEDFDVQEVQSPIASPSTPVSPSSKHKSILFSLGRKIAEKKINHTRETTDIDVSPQGNPIHNNEVLKKIEQGEKDLKTKKKRIHRHSMAHNPTIIIEPPAPGSASSVIMTTMRSHSGEHTITTTTTTTSRLSDSLMQRIEEEYPPVAETIPPSDYLLKLPLDSEVNTVRFLISATGETSFARIFKWDDNTKMVVSDVDGTITKSDIKGHIYTRLGRVDYTHEGISSLYTQIASNGYKFLYLTARPIGQIDSVRAYIQGIHQSESKMPHGPVITSPNSAFNALAREVVLKRPEVWKKAILATVRECFSENPFLAGFGNRQTDCAAYIAVGIDPSRSFRINTKGQVTIAASEQSFGSYLQIKKQINTFFPHMSPEKSEVVANMISDAKDIVHSKVSQFNDKLGDKMDDIAAHVKRTKSDM